MVVPESGINNIMGGLESAEGVRLHNHRRKLRQRFDIVRKLGQGTYGKVQLGINKETGQEVAIKIIKKCKIKTEADLIRIRREIQIMSSVRHPNIIHIYEVFENQDKMVLVMEYAAGGELYEYLNERNVLTEEEARRIFRQISTAIYYCHKHKICHRDLKLENILLDEHGSAKIADFGLSNVFSESRLLTTFCGSPLYASPEIVRGIPYHGPEVDCWSLGVLLYILVYKAMPFDGSNFKRLVRQISQGDYFEPKTTSPASPLIRSMLNVNPAHRADIISICSHWWVDQTYSESCLDISEDLANQTPVRLDLLLSLVPSVSGEKLVMGDIQVDPQASEKPVRSQSLDSIAPMRVNPQMAPINVPPLDPPVSSSVDNKVADGAGGEKKKVKSKSKRERSSSRTRKKESSTSIDSDPDGVKPKKKSVKKEETKISEVEDVQPEILENDEENIEKLKENIRIINDSLKTSEVNEVPEDPEKYSLDVKEISPSPENIPDKKEAKQEPLLEKSDNDQNVDKSKLRERRRSKVFETAEKFTSLNNTQGKQPAKKIFLPGVKVGDAKREYERKSSLVESSSNLARQSPSRKSFSSKSKSPSPAVSPEKKYSLASTINLNKLAESALKSDEGSPASSADVSRTSSVSTTNEVPAPIASSNKKVSVSEKRPESPPKKSPEKVVSNKSPEKIPKDSPEAPFSKSSSANTTPASDSDSAHQAKVKNAVKVISHAISVDGDNKAATIPRRKTSRADIVLAPPVRSIPVKTPEYKSEVEHFINEPEAPLKSQVTIPIAAPSAVKKPALKQGTQSKEHIIPIQFEEEASRKSTPTPPSSLHSLSKQSTFDSDSQISVSSSGEPIRKSPREVIIPIAVEGGGYVTPASDDMSRISSFDEVEEERPRGFSLHSTRRRHPHTQRIESADSISSDEDDDNFEILTAENLFSTLLNRVRSLTHKLSTEDGGQHAFPRSFFTTHQSIFDNLPSRRLAGTRSFARSDSAPWRRRNITSVPSGLPETYSARRLSKEDERLSRLDEKPPPYQSKSSYPASRPSYVRSLSNSLSSSNAYTNQYPWKYKINEQETNNVNHEARDSYRKGLHRHSFHGTGLNYCKLNGNYNAENLRADDLNLPMIPELGSSNSKLNYSTNKYSPSRWSSKTSDASSSQSDPRYDSDFITNENKPSVSNVKSRQSPASYPLESNRVSRIPTFQRSSSVNPETGSRRPYQRSYSVTPERNVSGSGTRLLSSNGPVSRASTPEPSSSRISSRSLSSNGPVSRASTPEPSSSRIGSRSLTSNGPVSRAATPEPSSSRIGSRSLSSNGPVSRASTPEPSSSRIGSRSLSSNGPVSRASTPEPSSSRISRFLPPLSSGVRQTPERKLSEDSPGSEKTTRYRRYGISSSASPLSSSSSRLSPRPLKYSSSSSNCTNPDKESKPSSNSSSSRISNRGLTYSNSSGNCASPRKESPSLLKSSSMNRLAASNQNRSLQKVASDAAINSNGKSMDESQKNRKINAYSRSLTTGANASSSKSDVMKRRSSFTSDNRNSLKATREKAIKDSTPQLNKMKASGSASSLARLANRKDEDKISCSKKYPCGSKENSHSNHSSNSILNNSKVETVAENKSNSFCDSLPPKQSQVKSMDLKSVDGRLNNSNSTSANLTDMSDNYSRSSMLRGENSQRSEITEGSITNQSSFSDFDESLMSSRRTSSASTLTEKMTEMKQKLIDSRSEESKVLIKDESSNQNISIGNGFKLINNGNEMQQSVPPKSPTKTSFKPQIVNEALRSKFEVRPVSDNGSNVDCHFTAKLPSKSETLPRKSEVRDIDGVTSCSSVRPRRFTEVFPGKDCDPSIDDGNSVGKRLHRFLESKINKDGKPIINYEFHRRLTSPSRQEQGSSNWIQDSSTSRYLNSYLRRSPSKPRQTESQEDRISTTPMRSSSGILVKRSSSGTMERRDSGGSSKHTSKSDLKLGIPKIMCNSEISSYDETSSIVSPTEDGSDTWSASSDYTDAFEYLPPTGRSHSCPTGPEDSVSDRIRRKSYYSRFNPAISSRKFLSSTLNFTNTLRPGSRLPSYSRSFSSDMSRSLNKF